MFILRRLVVQHHLRWGTRSVVYVRVLAAVDVEI